MMSFRRCRGPNAGTWGGTRAFGADPRRRRWAAPSRRLRRSTGKAASRYCTRNSAVIVWCVVASARAHVCVAWRQARDAEHKSFDQLKACDKELFDWFEGFLKRTYDICRLAGQIIALKVRPMKPCAAPVSPTGHAHVCHCFDGRVARVRLLRDDRTNKRRSRRSEQQCGTAARTSSTWLTLPAT